MRPTTQETILCPQCNQPVEVDLWQGLDLAHEPELRRRFVQGEIPTTGQRLRLAGCK